ncbi:MAG: serine hydrolase, partial [Flavobacteriales bacterium]
MKRLFTYFKWFFISSVGFILILYIFDVDYLLRAVKTVYLKGHTTAFLEDYKEFPNRTIYKGTAQPWAISKAYNSIPATDKLNTTHKNLQTVAFLIIKNDSIWHESYFDGYSATSKS